jgi:hypothetical protein
MRKRTISRFGYFSCPDAGSATVAQYAP